MPSPAQPAAALSRRDPDDPERRAYELVQRGQMIVDVAAADLHASESVHGPFHATTWHFRHALAEARRAWDRLRAELGSGTLKAALGAPPLTFLTLGGGPGHAPHVLILIDGQTYGAQRVAGTSIAPVLWRLTLLSTEPHDGPYYAGRLHDGSTQCDCAEWIYRIAESPSPALCKHLLALATLNWL